MVFDPTISFGAIFNALCLFIGFVVAFTRIGGRLDLMAQRLSTLEKYAESSQSNDKRLVLVEERVTTQGKLIKCVVQEVAQIRRNRNGKSHDESDDNDE